MHSHTHTHTEDKTESVTLAAVWLTSNVIHTAKFECVWVKSCVSRLPTGQKFCASSPIWMHQDVTFVCRVLHWWYGWFIFWVQNSYFWVHSPQTHSKPPQKACGKCVLLIKKKLSPTAVAMSSFLIHLHTHFGFLCVLRLPSFLILWMMCVWQPSCRSATFCRWVWCLRAPSSAALRRRQVTVASWLAPAGTSAPSSATTLTPGEHGSSCPPEPRRSCPRLTAPWLVSTCWWIGDRNVVFVEMPRFLVFTILGKFFQTKSVRFQKWCVLRKLLFWPVLVRKFHDIGQQIICSIVTRREKNWATRWWIIKGNYFFFLETTPVVTEQ